MPQITSENYVAGVLRTDSPVTPEMITRFSQPETIRLIHATLGMVTEAAELADMLKKHLFYGRPLDLVNAAEEIGDNLWYVGLAIDVLHTTMNDILTMNHEKLRLRYPEKFTEFHAENRNLTAERALLEGGTLVAKQQCTCQPTADCPSADCTCPPVGPLPVTGCTTPLMRDICESPSCTRELKGGPLPESIKAVHSLHHGGCTCSSPIGPSPVCPTHGVCTTPTMCSLCDA